MKVPVTKALMMLSLFAFLFLAACTSYANKEELQQMDERKAKVQSMRQQVQTLTSEKAKAEKDLSAKKQKLDTAKKEKEMVLKRLQEIEKANQGGGN
jgi:outer membrane biogenesis lipoprotein LolB